jgi:ELWxxDGT repeat protein
MRFVLACLLALSALSCREQAASSATRQDALLQAPTLAMATDASSSYSSVPTNWVPLGTSRTLFLASTPTEGNELWVTDGTAAGTHPVVDLRSGPQDGILPRRLLGGDAGLFLGEDGVHSSSLWQTDGTLGGTHLVYEPYAGRPGNVYSIGEFGGGLVVLVGGHDISNFSRDVFLYDRERSTGVQVAAFPDAPGGFGRLGDKLYFSCCGSMLDGGSLRSTSPMAAWARWPTCRPCPASARMT